MLLDLTRMTPAHRYRELREVFARIYWSETGSITAGLRRAVAAANRRLFFANLDIDPSERCVGGMTCAVLRDDNVFIVQTGSLQVYAFSEGRLERLSPGSSLTPLGMSRMADVRLRHVFVAPGDKLLLASSSLLQAVGEGGLARVIPREGLTDTLDGLEQIGADADFVALLMHCTTLEKASAARELLQSLSQLKETVRSRPEPAPELTPQPTPEPKPEPTLAEAEAALAPRMPEAPPYPIDLFQPSPVPPETERPVEQIPVRIVEASDEPPPASYKEMPEIVRESTPGLGADLMERVGEGARLGLGSIGHGLAAAGGVIVGGLRALPRRVLPGPERGARRPSRSVSRPVPEEDASKMIAIAVGIPILLAIVVIWAYQAFGEKSQFQSVIDQAKQAIEQAQSSGGVVEPARSHWEMALEQADAARALRPDDQVAIDLQTKARSALDQLDGIVRLSTRQLWDFGPSTVPRRLVAHGQMIFVLDPAGEWVARLTLNANGDGVVERDGNPFIVRRGQEIGGASVGALLDFIWVEPMGGRQTSGLLILEEDGAIVTYDPAWEGEGGEIQLSRFALESPPAAPVVVDTYNGRLYVLDADANQIRRYQPQGDRYPGRPENYFVDSPPRPMREALDMAIDGYVYLLYPGGEIHKFLGGKPDTFAVQNLPGDLSQAHALTVDPNGGSGAIYVLDQGRVLVLGPDGAFRAQFRADDVFDNLEAAVMDESTARLYGLSDGRLYVAFLP